MPRTCTVCTHAAREEIDAALVRRTPYRKIAQRFSVSETALSRHLNDHLADYVQKALSKYGLEKGVKVLDKLTSVLHGLDDFLNEAKANRNAKEFVKVAAELRRELELLAKLQGDLPQEGTVNIHLHPEWLTIEATIHAALDPFPAARESVVSALKELPNGDGGSLRDSLLARLSRVEFARNLGLEPDPWQEEFLSSNANRVLLNCSRQSGKSTMAAVLALHRGLYYPGSLVLCLAPAERQAKELFTKVARFYADLGHPMPADSYRRLGMELANGSRIEALPGTEKTIRGFSGVDLLIVDEASRVDDELYFAVRPMLAISGGRLLMLSTPYGKRGVFYDAWTSGADWEAYEVPASDCPRITEEFLAQERKELPPFVFRQEYECSFEETEDAVFTEEMVDASVSSEIAPLFPSGSSL